MQEIEYRQLVSIFLPYYNDKKFLNKTIESVLNQTYENWELILFNHASTDGSREIAHSYTDKRIKHIDAEENLGAGSGYNLKFSLPYMDKNSKYLKLLCADDSLYPNFLEVMVAHLDANPDTAVVFCDMEYEDECGKKLKTSWIQEHSDTLKSYDNADILKQIIMRASPLPFPANLIRMNVLNDVVLDQTSVMLFDISLWGQILVKNLKIDFIKEKLVTYKISNTQVSSYKNFKKTYQQSFFESSWVYNIFYEIRDVNLIKKAFKGFEFVDELKEDDSEFIPFIIAYYFLSSIEDNYLLYSCHIAVQINGYNKLCELLRDEDYAKKLKERFGFGIKEFRDRYSYMLNSNKNCSLKSHIFAKPVKKLTIPHLLFLLGRQLFHIISPNYWIKKCKKKHKKTYTV